MCHIIRERERDRERFLLLIGERAAKGQGCNVIREQHPKKIIYIYI